MRRLAFLFWAALPATSLAQGSGFNTDFRLITFDEARPVCLAAETPIFESHDAPAFGNTMAAIDTHARAISLDQDWVEVEIGSATYLVRPVSLSFGPCPPTEPAS